MQKQNSSKIILGSSSIYRNQLLGRILDTFEAISPNIDENNYKSLDARKRSQKIALNKADFISKNQKDTVIICADQIGEINNRILTKPLN
ncbi:MAG: septum formation protein, partial [Woeseiaceae bacterium]